MHKKKSQLEFGSWLLRLREDKKKTRGAFASALGYSNLSKGAKRILRWEQGEEDPDEQYHVRICLFLDIETVVWQEKRALRERGMALHRIYEKAHVQVKQNTEQLLARYCDLLLSHTNSILSFSNFRHIPLPGLFFSMAFGGGTIVPLGALLQAWSQGHLRTKTTWIFSGGCSPLSGSNSLSGFDDVTRRISGFRNIFPRASTEIGPMIELCRQMSAGVSSWSLPQLLAQLGEEIPPVDIFRDEEKWGTYDFQSCVLHIGAEDHHFPLDIEDVGVIHTTSLEIEDDVEKRGGHLFLGDLHTGQKGLYVGEKYRLHTDEKVWGLRSGNLLDEEGIPVLHWSADLPLPVAEALCSLYEAQRKKNAVQ